MHKHVTRVDRRKFESEDGFYLVLSVSLVVMLLALAGLMIAVGILTGDLTRLQSANNLAALGAIEAYSQVAPDSSDKPMAAKISAATARARDILGRNPLLSILSPIYDKNLELEFGAWYREAPASGNPCSDKYPCFREVPDKEKDPASAIRVKFSAVQDNETLLGLSRWIGAGPTQLKSQATASLVQRCVKYVIDISMSVIAETHNPTWTNNDVIVDPNATAGQPALRFKDTLPATPALFAFHAYRVATGYGGFKDCSNLANYSDNPELIYWCNMPEHRDGNYAGPQRHFRSDYAPTISQNNSGHGGDDLYVDSFFHGYDTYKGPEPFTSSFLAFNAGLREMAARASPSDMAGFTAFAGAPPFEKPWMTVRLTPQIGYLTQLTNVLNRGMFNAQGAPVYSELQPNIIDLGMFPIVHSVETTSTNLVGALNDVISEMGELCPVSAQKSIILASDFVGTCHRRVGSEHYDCGRDLWEYFSSRSQEGQILALNDPGSPIRRMLDGKISFTPLVYGKQAGANFLNIKSADGSHYLSAEEAAYLGYGAGPEIVGGTGLPFFEVASHIPPELESDFEQWSQQCRANYSPAQGAAIEDCDSRDAYTLTKLGQSNFSYPRASALAGQLAMLSGGNYCAIMPICPGNETACNVGSCAGIDCPPQGCSETNFCYQKQSSGGPEILRDCAREGVSVQRCSVTNSTPAEQAAQCVVKTVSKTPWVLVE